MDRKEFIIYLGKGAAFVTLAGCLGSCGKDDNPSSPNPPAGVDFTIDLNSSENAALKTAGGYIYKNSVIVANIGSNSYVAVSQACTHQGFTLVFEQSGSRFHCNNHGSNFSTSGSVINGPATRALTRYNVEVNGNIIRVFS